jgi:hypothetical protein
MDVSKLAANRKLELNRDVKSHCPFLCSNDTLSQILSSDESKNDAEINMENHATFSVESNDVSGQPKIVGFQNQKTKASLEKAYETHDVARQPILLRNLSRWSTDNDKLQPIF